LSTGESIQTQKREHSEKIVKRRSKGVLDSVYQGRGERYHPPKDNPKPKRGITPENKTPRLHRRKERGSTQQQGLGCGARGGGGPRAGVERAGVSQGGGELDSYARRSGSPLLRGQKSVCTKEFHRKMSEWCAGLPKTVTETGHPSR